MIRAAYAAFAAILFLAMSAPAHAETRADRQVAQILTDWEAYDRASDPITAGGEGDRQALRHLPDASAAGIERDRVALTTFQNRLQQAANPRLSADSELNRAFLLRVVDDRLGGIRFDQARMPLGNDSGFFNTADYLALTTPIQTADDAEAWLSRLGEVPKYYRDNIDNMRRGMATGFTQPRVVIERVIAIAEAQANTAPEANTLMAPFADMPDTISAAQQAQYRERALTLVRDQIVPAQRETVRFLREDYLPAARPELGIRSTPNGEAYYRFLVQRHTTTNMSPEEIHALGEQEVARIRGLMENAIRESGFRGTFSQFLRYLRTDRRFYPTSADDLLMRASEIAKRADGQLPRLFGTLPRLTYDVRPVPAEMAEGYTTGRYWQGSLALGQAGGYIVNTTHLDQRGLYELPALTLHEAVPGHHLQIALAQELGDLPYFRRNTFVTAYTEGWGLYSEYLGEEMGIYRDPYELFGRYSYEMWRACRLVADTGIHWMGWSLAQARQCFEDNSALSQHNITTELERYVSDPGQALGYKIGELTILRLRREATEALGERFNVREFHDVVLGAGALPMDVLEARVRAWVASQQTAH